MVFIGCPWTTSTLTPLKHCSCGWGLKEFVSCCQHVENTFYCTFKGLGQMVFLLGGILGDMITLQPERVNKWMLIFELCKHYSSDCLWLSSLLCCSYVWHLVPTKITKEEKKIWIISSHYISSYYFLNWHC